MKLKIKIQSSHFLKKKNEIHHVVKYWSSTHSIKTKRLD